MLGHASDNQGNAYPPPPSSLPQRKGRQVLVAVSLAFETRGGGTRQRGRCVRIVECSSVGPWPRLEQADFCRVLVVECCAAGLFVECSLFCAALRMKGVGGCRRHSCILMPSFFFRARAAPEASHPSAGRRFYFRGLVLLALRCIPAVCEQMVRCLIVQSCSVSLLASFGHWPRNCPIVGHFRLGHFFLASSLASRE